jgi:hypothetical protein
MKKNQNIHKKDVQDIKREDLKFFARYNDSTGEYKIYRKWKFLFFKYNELVYKADDMNSGIKILNTLEKEYWFYFPKRYSTSITLHPPK